MKKLFWANLTLEYFGNLIDHLTLTSYITPKYVTNVFNDFSDFLSVIYIDYDCF